MIEKLNKYSQLIQEDLKINEMNLSERSFNVPHKKHFWLTKMIEEKSALNKLEKKKKELIKEASLRVVEEQVVKMSESSLLKLVNNTELIKAIDQQIEDQKLIVEYLEKVEKIFSFITNDIKNIIETLQLQNM